MTNKTILLVDDNPGEEVLVRRALSVAKMDHKVVVLRDGEEALEYFFRQGKYAGRNADDLPALVLLDLKLPKVDGKEVLRRLRSSEETRRTPVVVFTSSREVSDVKDAFAIGCNSYVCKPMSFDALTDVIHRIASYWLGLNEPVPR